MEEGENDRDKQGEGSDWSVGNSQHSDWSVGNNQRPKWRDTKRKETNVKVYTISQESTFLFIPNVPVFAELTELFALFAPLVIYHHQTLRHSQFEYEVLLKFKTLNQARKAKKRVNGKSFLGSVLEVHYAPQYEAEADTKAKLLERKTAFLSTLLPSSSQ